MRQHKTFTTLAKAVAFCDELETLDIDYSVTHIPASGVATVGFGKDDDDMLSEEGFLKSVLAEEDRRQKELDVERQGVLMHLGRDDVAKKLVLERGLSGIDADMFLAGFLGEPARCANPRAVGKEHIFREGRALRGDEKVRKAVRAAAASHGKDTPRQLAQEVCLLAQPIANGECFL